MVLLALLLPLLLSLAPRSCAPRPPPHMAPSPPQVLPQLDGASFPAFRTVFQNGECDMDDPGGPGSGPIALKKRCYSCFRIPAIVRNFHTGTIHAFAEARRGDLGDLPAFHGMMSSASDPAVLCPDIPDTSLAYKRSTDGGLTFSSLTILDEVLGRCRGQPTPVVDNVTQELFLAFNDGCNPGAKGVQQGPMLMSSKDDGHHWSNASKIVCHTSPCVRGTMPSYVVPGDSRGMVTPTTVGGNSSVRLWIPTWSGPMYSDSHGATWSLASNPGGPKLQNGGAGENSVTKFSNGSFDGYVMMMRCENEAKVPGCKGVYASISFSKDMLTWSPRTPVLGLNPWIQGAADQNSVLGVKGGLVFTHGGCTPSSRAPACLNVTSSAVRLRGGGNNRRRLSGGNGMKLLFSSNGFDWRLLETLWPFDGGYSTLAAIEQDEDGNVTRYMTFFEAGGLFSGRQALLINNFTVPAGGYN